MTKNYYLIFNIFNLFFCVYKQSDISDHIISHKFSNYFNNFIKRDYIYWFESIYFLNYYKFQQLLSLFKN
jgi:hypothetical protein